MTTDRLQLLAALDSAQLREIVRRAQASPSFDIESLGGQAPE